MAAIEVANPGLKGVLPKDYNRPALDKVMLGELIDLVSGIAMGEQGDKAKDIFGRVYEYFLLHYVRMEQLSNEALPVQALKRPKEKPRQSGAESSGRTVERHIHNRRIQD